MAKSQGKAPEEEDPIIFFIPDNYTNSGGFFGGMFQLRNLIEAGAFGLGLYFLESNLLSVDMIYKIIIMVITIAPVVILSVIGIRGDCFSQFLLAVVAFIKDRRKLRFRRIENFEKASENKRGFIRKR